MSGIGRIGEEHEACHAGFDDDGMTGIEVEEAAFGAARDADDPTVANLGAKPCEVGTDPDGAAIAFREAHAGDRTAFDRAANPTDHGFDFGEFRHVNFDAKEGSTGSRCFDRHSS